MIKINLGQRELVYKIFKRIQNKLSSLIFLAFVSKILKILYADSKIRHLLIYIVG